MNKLILGFITITMLTMTSCSPKLSPFNHQLNKQFGFSKDELTSIQFYLSDDIVLYRDYGGQKSDIRNGAIKLIDGRKVEEVVFKAGTPGVYLFSPERNHFAISFEEGSDRYLVFGPNPKLEGRYVLLASDWNKRRGVVNYGGKKWHTPSSSAYTMLMVDVDQARKTNYEKTTVGGRRVN